MNVPTLRRLQQARRERVLAGPARQASYSRGEAWRRLLKFVRGQWLFLIGAMAIPVIAALPAAYLKSGVERGLILGAAISGGVSLALGFALIASGAAMRVMGALGENYTALDLKPLRRHGWKVVHGIRASTTCDIDHVLIGPPGVFVIETKWSGDEWPLAWSGDHYMEQTLDKARRQALRGGRVVKTLMTAAEIDCVITPVAVLWSPHRNDTYQQSIATVAGVTTIAGHAFAGWLHSLHGQVLAPTEIQRAWEVLDRHTQATDHDAPPRPTIEQQLSARVLQPLAGMLAAFYALVGVTRVGNLWTDIAGVLVAASVGYLGLRWRTVRGLAVGWLAGIAVCVLAVVVLLVRLTV